MMGWEVFKDGAAIGATRRAVHAAALAIYAGGEVRHSGRVVFRPTPGISAVQAAQGMVDLVFGEEIPTQNDTPSHRLRNALGVN